jgi:hypothetical protein
MSIDPESLKLHIPQYLAAADQQRLAKEILAVSRGAAASYYLGREISGHETACLQGDGWRGFQAVEFDSGEKRPVRGIVLSNSCDIDPDNPRDVPTRITFAPIVRLSKYEELLAQAGIDADRITAKVSAIKSQSTTTVFYLPAGGNLDEDHLVRFDDVHSMPTLRHLESADRMKLFTLSMTGFYLFVLKLSIHFCRLQEKVNRPVS